MISSNFPVGDFLVRIKNAALARKQEVEIVNSKLIEALAKVLKKEGILTEIKKSKGKLTVGIAYRKKEPILLDLKIVSKPGLRIYMSVDELSAIRRPSFFILSTPKGILTSKEAIKGNIGGEVIVEIW